MTTADNRRLRWIVAALSVIAVGVAMYSSLISWRANLESERAQGNRVYAAPANGDHMYYTSMMLQFAGQSFADAMSSTAVYFDYPGDWRTLRFNNPDIAPLVYPRTVLPLAAVPFVGWRGPAAIFVPGLICAFLLVCLLWSASRRFGCEWALAPPLVLFCLGLGYREYASGIYTEAILMVVVVGIVLALPWSGERMGLHRSLWLVTLIVVSALTRQAGLMVAAMVLGAYVGGLLFRSGARRQWARSWSTPVALAVGFGALSTLLVQRWAPYDALEYTQTRYDSATPWEAIRAGFSNLPATFGDALSNLPDSKSAFLVFLMLGVLSLIALWREPLAWATLGAAAVPVLTIALNGHEPFRYLSPVYPLLVIVMSLALHRLLARFIAPYRAVASSEVAHQPRSGARRSTWISRLSGFAAVLVCLVVIAATAWIYQPASRTNVWTISRTEAGNRWPFSVDSVVVSCGGDDGQIWVSSAGETYALSGTAMARRGRLPTAREIRLPSQKPWAGQSSWLLNESLKRCPNVPPTAFPSPFPRDPAMVKGSTG